MTHRDDIQRTHEPHDRLTGLAADMLDIVDGIDGVKVIVLLADETMSGAALSGWRDDIEAAVYMLTEVQVVMKANGQDLRIMTKDGVFI